MSFEKEVIARIDEIGKNEQLKASAHEFMLESLTPKYS